MIRFFAKLMTGAMMGVGLASTANATALTFTLGDILSGSFGDAHIAKGVFTDTLTFTLAEDSLFSASLTSAATRLKAIGDLDFTSVVLTGGDSPYSFSIVNNGGSDGKTDSAAYSGFLSAGTYTISITGFSYGGAQFGANTTVSAVPETASWLTMGAGLIAIGLTRRRAPPRTRIA